MSPGWFICNLTDEGACNNVVCFIYTGKGWVSGECLGKQELPDGGAEIVDVMGRWIILGRNLHGYTCSSRYIHTPLLTRKSMWLSHVIGKFVWSGEKTQVLFIKKLKISSFFSQYSFIPFFHRYCLPLRVLGTAQGAGETTVNTTGTAPAFRSQLPSPMRRGALKVLLWKFEIHLT